MNVMKLIKEKRGNGTVDIAVTVVAVMLVLALCMNVLPLFILKFELSHFAKELCHEAVIAGRIDTETTERTAELTEEMGISPTVEWSESGNIQLGEVITVTVSLEKQLGNFGGFGGYTVTLKSVATGKSQRYWK